MHVNSFGHINVIKNLEGFKIEVQRMWNVTASVILVAIRATGTISKSLRQYLSYIPGKDKIKQLQKTAIFGSAPYCEKC